MRKKIYPFILAFCLVGGVIGGSAQKRRTATSGQISERIVTILTEPGATVWLNGVNRGVTDENGRLIIKMIPAGTQTLKVRADGFGQITQNLSQKGEIKITLTKTNDEAELAFQQAEKTAGEDAKKAEEFYRKAIRLRPKYAEAYIGLARLLTGEGFYEEAHEAIAGARKILPVYPEASAVEGRVFNSEGEEEKAIEAFKRAIREGKGFQPEAHTGLALLYKDKAESLGASGDFQGEAFYYEAAVKSFAPAVKQLSGAPDAVIIYQLYGLVLEKMKRNQEAIKVYEEFLRIFPDISESEAVRSFIIQLKKQLETGR